MLEGLRSGCGTERNVGNEQARTGRGIHGLPKVSPRPAMPIPYTPQTALRPFGGVARPQSERPAAVFFPLGYPFPYGSGNERNKIEFHDQGDNVIQ
jgi:hypothetical protein